MAAWEFHQDDDIPAEHLDVLANAERTMGNMGAGSVTLTAMGDQDQLLSVYSLVRVVALHRKCGSHGNSQGCTGTRRLQRNPFRFLQVGR